MAIIAHRMSVESFGQFTFISAVVLIANTFTNFGTDTYMIRKIARTRKTTSLVSNVLGFQLIHSAMWWILALLVRPSPSFLVYSLSLFPLALFSVATASLRGFERMDLLWTLSLTNGLLHHRHGWRYTSCAKGTHNFVRRNARLLHQPYS